jgi:hypothetical protein
VGSFRPSMGRFLDIALFGVPGDSGCRVTDRYWGVTVRYGMVHRASATDEHLRGQFHRFGRRGWTDGVVVVPKTSRSSYNRLGLRASISVNAGQGAEFRGMNRDVRFSEEAAHDRSHP